MQLVIEKYGTKLRASMGKFEVVGKDIKKHFSAELLSHIYLHKQTSITTDAMALAVKHQIPIVVIDNNGHPVCRVWSNSYGSISTIRKNQAYFSDSEEAMFKIKEITLDKVKSQHSLLEKIKNERASQLEQLSSVLNFMARQISSIEDLNTLGPNFKNQIRGYEGGISRAYFSTLGALVPKRYAFKNRSRQPALDMLNAVLNYMYGILYTHVEGAIIKAGLDPYMGIMHRDTHNKPVLTYDLIEPYRVWADTVALRLCTKSLLHEQMFSVHQGGYWLERSGKKIVIETFNDFMDVVIQRRHLRRNRLHHIEHDIIELAQYIRNASFTPCSKNEKENGFT